MLQSQDGSRLGEEEELGPGLDDFEPVPDDDANRDAFAGSQDGTTEDGIANEEEEDGEELFGDNYMRLVSNLPDTLTPCCTRKCIA